MQIHPSSTLWSDNDEEWLHQYSMYSKFNPKWTESDLNAEETKKKKLK